MNEQLRAIANHIASGKGGLPPEWQDWAEEIESSIRLLADAEPKPIGILTAVRESTISNDRWLEITCDKSAAPLNLYCPVYAQPPADQQPAAWGESLRKHADTQHRLLPHNFREMVNELRDTAVKYHGCQQLREQLSVVLDKYIVSDHADQLRQRCLVMWFKRLSCSLKRAGTNNKLVDDAATYLKEHGYTSAADIPR